MFVDDQHPSFQDKPDGTSRVWRYMDLARFLSMLENRALHFARADQMSDRWEGSFSPLNVAMRPQIYGEHWATMKDQIPMLRAHMMQRMHMSCWHLSETESAAMWMIYQQEGRGVAVQSTWHRLTTSLRTDRSVHGGRVKYIDYNRTFISEGNAVEAYMHKRESFAHEKEVRLMMVLTGRSAPDPAHPKQAIDLGPEAPVIPIPVDLTELVEQVLIAPDAPVWFADLIAQVVTRYGLEVPVRQSDLARDPVS